MKKKGYIRTLEAVIAIVIILIFIFTMMPKKEPNPKDVPPRVDAAQKYILQEIANTPELRQEAIETQEEDNECIEGGLIEQLIQANVPPGYSYACAVCSSTGCVFMPEGVTTSVYMDDILITPDDATLGPKIVRLWFWALQ